MFRSAAELGRASFSFILNEHTLFQSDFHQSFLYRAYVTVMNRMDEKEKYEPHEFREKIDRWFPQWNNMKKNFLFDYVTTSRYKKPKIGFNRTIYDEESYSAGMTYLNLLPMGYAGRGRKNIIPVEDVALHKPSPGKHCRYCPYNFICRDAIYSLDYEDDQ